MKFVRSIVLIWVIGIIGFLPGMLIGVYAQSQPFTIGFPILGGNPYTAPIITVLDHSAPYFYDANHKSVQAYTGEMGQGGCSPSGLKDPSSPCGYYNTNFTPNDSSDTRQFIVNGNYVGTNADCAASNETSPCLEEVKVLNYRGHSGYDYAYPEGTAIIAAADGDLYVPARDWINNPQGTNDPWCDFHTFYIDHGNGWTTWYLHADHIVFNGQPVDAPHGCNGLVSTGSPEDIFIGHVKKGDEVGVVGDFAYGKNGGVGYHLHFEVRRGCERVNNTLQNCLVVDPYGWEWAGGDLISNVQYSPASPFAGQPAAAAQTAPLWDLGSQMPVVTNVTVAQSPDGYTATINGTNFAPGAKVTMWARSGFYWAGTLTPCSTCVSATQITVDLPASQYANPTQYLLKVRNPDGPRSHAAGLSLTQQSSSSVPLVLDGTPAPGGGTIVSFAGFESINDRGQEVVSTGVDTNGDGTPDTFTDFIWQAGQLKQITVPGFSNISSVSTHVKVNAEGDMAFGVNSGSLPSAIYLLPSGSSSPSEIIGVGQPCPSDCPSGNTIAQLMGPLAISNAGDVAFAVSLSNSWSQTSTDFYLYVYRAATKSIDLVAADGPGGTPAPVGGTFAPGALSGPLDAFTSDGDLIFYVPQIEGGSSQSGIFRYSATEGLSKVVAQGDPVPKSLGGTLTTPQIGTVCSISGRQLVFTSRVTGGSSNQIIGVVSDVTKTPTNFKVVAYQGEETGTNAGGTFDVSPGVPFGGYGENTAPPCIRSDGTVIFHSMLTGATADDGSTTDMGVFSWNGVGFQKIVVDGDHTASGKAVEGVFAPVSNDIGEVYYFVARLQ